MTACVTVVAGPAGCGKTWRLLARYRQVLASSPPGAALWLVPTHRAGVAVGQQVLDGMEGCLSPNVLTFDQLARNVLASSALRVRPLEALGQRQLLRQVVHRASGQGQLKHFERVATTAGFMDLLVAFVRELKRLEIWPDELAQACGTRPEAKDRELCQLYAEYQRLLTEHDLYDAQGRFWSARQQLRDGQLRPFERVRHVFVDGFTDFTRTEHEILEILAGRVDTLSISLPLEPGMSRSDLFTKTRLTLDELGRRHGNVTVDAMPRRGRNWPAMEHLEQHLFANPHDVPRAADPSGIEIIAAASARGEVELVAGRIKRLLARGDSSSKTPNVPVAPGDVVVVFRSLAEVADLVRDVFGEFGIPAAVDSSLPLARVAEFSVLAAWLRLDLEDWPLGPLVSLLVHNCFRPAWPEWRGGQAALAAESLVRRLQIRSSRQELLSEVERLAAGDDPSESRSSAAQAIQREARLALPLLRRIGQMLDRLPRRAAPKVWAQALAALGRKKTEHKQRLLFPDEPKKGSELFSGAAENSSDPFFFEAAERLSAWLGEAPAQMSRAEVYDYVCDVLRCESLRPPYDEAGRVRVLSADSARNLSVPYLFVAGLDESAFPLTAREDCLLGEADIRHLSARGLPLVSKAQRSAYEMLLFYEVATRATRRLTLSYAALDQAAQPLSPSPYLTEIERLFDQRSIQRHQATDLSPLPISDDVLTPREFRVRAVASAVEGNPAMMVELCRHASTSAAATNVVAALRASCSRQSGSAFGPYEGMLTSPAARRVLGERFNSQHCWSPSRLEQYQLCPYQFFLQRVVGLDPPDDPMLSTDYLGRGQMLHELLAALHSGLSERGELLRPGSHSEREFADNTAALVARLVQRLRSGRPLADGLLEIDARRLSQWLDRYHAQHEKYAATWSDWESTHVEVPFGPQRRGQAQPDPEAASQDMAGSSEPFVLDCDGEMVRFAGRIDRIDVGSLGGQTVFNVIDYKSGSAKRTNAKAVMSGSALQLPLYALAAEQLLAQKRAVPLHAAYWHVAGRGYGTVIEFHEQAAGSLRPTDDWTSLQGRLRKQIRGLVHGIRQGEFPMHSSDDQCTSWCSYSTLCRVNQVRALEKQWQPPTETPT